MPDPFYDGTKRSEALPCGDLEGVVARRQIVEIEIGLLVGGGWGLRSVHGAILLSGTRF